MFYLQKKGRELVRINSPVPVYTDDLDGIVQLDSFKVAKYLIVEETTDKQKDLIEIVYSLLSGEKPYKIVELPDDDAAKLWFSLECSR